MGGCLSLATLVVMKTPATLLLAGMLLLAIEWPLAAQEAWGLQAGINVSVLGTTGTYQPRLGWHGGLYYSQHNDVQFGWQVGLQYSLQGARINNGYNGRLSYHYLNLPLLLRLYFSGPYYIEVGPQGGYLLNAQYREQGGYSESKTAVVQKFDIQAVAGIGREQDDGSTLGMRFAFGFTNTSGASVGNDFVARNLVLQLYYAPVFNHKK